MQRCHVEVSCTGAMLRCHVRLVAHDAGIVPRVSDLGSLGTATLTLFRAAERGGGMHALNETRRVP